MSDRRLRLMTYNVKGLSLDEAAAVRVVRAADPDVLGIQEPTRGPRGTTRMRRFASATGMVPVVVGHGARTTALLVAERCRRDVQDAGARRLPVRGPRTRPAPPIPRGWAVAMVAGVRVAVVHLSLDRAERVRHLDLVLRDLAAEGRGGRAALGHVVMGDLNEEPDGPTWTRLLDGLADAGPGAPTFSARHPRGRIDAVLVSPGLAVVGAAVPTGQDVERGSDHRPVVVDLALPV